MILTMLTLNACNSWRGGVNGAPYKATSKPYKIRGRWYYPQQHYEYDEMGIASWYGPGFHRNKTANGEIFDQDKISAAHRTLPLPCIAVVTNLENGRMVKLRVNDRGPFVDHHDVEGRLIDVSKKTAELLGFLQKGTAKVRVETVVDESVAMNQGIDDKGANVGFLPMAERKVTVKTLDGKALPPVVVAPEFPPHLTHVTTATAPPTGQVQQGRAQAFRQIYLEAGPYSHKADADFVLRKFTAYGRTLLKMLPFGKQNVYLVRMGPFINVQKADTMLQYALKMGYKDAKIIVE